MSKSMMGTAGGLSAADRKKLIPENIREGVSIAKVTGIVKESAFNVASFTGWLDNYMGLTAASWYGDGYVDRGKIEVRNNFEIETKNIPVKKGFSGYIQYPQGKYANLVVTKNGTAISEDSGSPTTFVAGDNIVLSIKYLDKSLRTIYTAVIYTSAESN